MNRRSKLLSVTAAIGFLCAWPRASLAADCVTDMDCPESTCGGQVCQWVSTTSHVCQDAGSKSRGSDGWCNSTADCKCQSVGATCNAQFSCSFVLAADAPAAGGASGAASAGASGSGAVSGGSSASGGDTSGGALASGSDDAGSNSVAGSGTQTASDGPITGSPSAPDSSCRLGGAPTRGDASFGLGVLGAALLFVRRRRAS